MLKRINLCTETGESFAFETTLSGRLYVNKIRDWQAIGYRVIFYYFQLPSENFALARVKLRVESGGHNIPVNTVRRRFKRSLLNLEQYKQVVDSWSVFDSSGSIPVFIEGSNETDKF